MKSCLVCYGLLTVLFFWLSSDSVESSYLNYPPDDVDFKRITFFQAYDCKGKRTIFNATRELCQTLPKGLIVNGLAFLDLPFEVQFYKGSKCEGRMKAWYGVYPGGELCHNVEKYTKGDISFKVTRGNVPDNFHRSS